MMPSMPVALSQARVRSSMQALEWHSDLVLTASASVSSRANQLILHRLSPQVALTHTTAGRGTLVGRQTEVERVWVRRGL